MKGVDLKLCYVHITEISAWANGNHSCSSHTNIHSPPLLEVGSQSDHGALHGPGIAMHHPPCPYPDTRSGPWGAFAHMGLRDPYTLSGLHPRVLVPSCPPCMAWPGISLPPCFQTPHSLPALPYPNLFSLRDSIPLALRFSLRRDAY